MRYRNSSAAIDTFKTRGNDKLSMPVGKIRPGEEFSADDLGSILQLTFDTAAAKAGQFLYQGGLVPIADPVPPTPPPSSEYILHVKDGVTRKFIPE